MVVAMAHKLYVVHGSHPCATVEKALELKGIPYKTVEMIPPSHALLQQLRFGARTVPAMLFEDGTKVSGSRALLERLEEMVPQPSVYGADAETQAPVRRAEEWGDEVLQPIARRLLWFAFAKHPQAMPGYQAGSKLPALPPRVVVALAPVITRLEARLNDVDEGNVRSDLKALPAHLDRIDAWIGEGVMGGEQPNAADLQIATTLRLLMTIGDVKPLIAPRPAGALTFRLLEPLPGSVPAGVLPAQWVPEPPSPSRTP